MNELDEDYENIRAALEWATTHDPCAGMRMLAGTRDLFYKFAQVEGFRLAERLLERCHDHDRYRAIALIAQGQLAYAAGDIATSRRGLKQAHLAAQTVAQQPGPGVKKTSPVPPRLRPRPAKRRKPSVIEDEIHSIEAEIAAVQTAIESHDGTDWQRLTELSTQQGTLTARLESLLEEWEASMATEGG